MTEILVAIGIIAVLVGLLFPAATKAIESARSSKCLNNLKQVGSELLIYSSDNNGYLPWYDASLGLKGMWWYRVYVSQDFKDFTRKMVCPSDKAPYQFRYPSDVYSLKGSYAFNKYLGYINSAGTQVYPVKRLNTLAKPSIVPVLADFLHTQPDKTDDSMGFESWTAVVGRHGSGKFSNVFCADGHIEAVNSATNSSLDLNLQKNN